MLLLDQMHSDNLYGKLPDSNRCPVEPEGRQGVAMGRKPVLRRART